MNGQARTSLVDWGGESINHSVQDDGGPHSFRPGAVERKKQGPSD